MNDMSDVSKDVTDFHKLQADRKLAIIGILVFVFVFAILIGTYMAKRGGSLLTIPGKKSETSQTAQNVDATSLTMAANPAQLSVGGTTIVTVSLSQTPVQAVDVIVNFDPKMFRASNIVNGTVYDDILRSEVDNGQVIMSGTVSPSDPTNLRTGDVFSFTLEALATGGGALSFDRDLTITAKNGVNTLGSAEGTKITVTQ